MKEQKFNLKKSLYYICADLEKRAISNAIQTIMNLNGIEIIKKRAVNEGLKVNDLIVFYTSLFINMYMNDSDSIEFWYDYDESISDEVLLNQICKDLKKTINFCYGSSPEETMNIIKASLAILDEYNLIYQQLGDTPTKTRFCIRLIDELDKGALITLRCGDSLSLVLHEWGD